MTYRIRLSDAGYANDEIYATIAEAEETIREYLDEDFNDDYEQDYMIVDENDECIDYFVHRIA